MLSIHFILSYDSFMTVFLFTLQKMMCLLLSGEKLCLTLDGMHTWIIAPIKQPVRQLFLSLRQTHTHTLEAVLFAPLAP